MIYENIIETIQENFALSLKTRVICKANVKQNVLPSNRLHKQNHIQQAIEGLCSSS